MKWKLLNLNQRRKNKKTFSTEANNFHLVTHSNTMYKTLFKFAYQLFKFEFDFTFFFFVQFINFVFTWTFFGKVNILFNARQNLFFFLLKFDFQLNFKWIVACKTLTVLFLLLLMVTNKKLNCLDLCEPEKKKKPSRDQWSGSESK